MKKLKIIIPAIALAGVLLSGCAANSTETEVVEDKPSMFIQVEDSYVWEVYYHRDTKVMYVVSDGNYSRGNFTVLVNPDGSPMLWGEENNE